MSFSLFRPSPDQIWHFLRRQRARDFSYESVGGTRDAESPAGFRCDQHRVLLGYGQGTFDRACLALNHWKMFPSEMCTLLWPEIPIETGSVVGILFHAGVIWSLEACRIVYVVNDQSDGTNGELARYGFAYGTIDGHFMRGEERFLVQWDRGDNSVWYEILCFARPRHFLAWVGFPYLRFQQNRFRQLSSQAMRRAANVCTLPLDLVGERGFG